MFYHLSGIVAETEPNLAVIDCGGVGYAVNVTHNTLAKLSIGDKAKLYISEIIRDEVFDLYGFADKMSGAALSSCSPFPVSAPRPRCPFSRRIRRRGWRWR